MLFAPYEPCGELVLKSNAVWIVLVPVSLATPLHGGHCQIELHLFGSLGGYLFALYMYFYFHLAAVT